MHSDGEFVKRLFIVYNPRSSRAMDVKREILAPARELTGYLVGKYEIEKTDVDKNAVKFAKLLEDGDTVLTAGGDATAVIAVNAILQSGKDVRLAVLPYGNFNDLARTLGTKNIKDVLTKTSKERKLYPLEIIVDGRLIRYATCYVTMGMTAEAVKLYDETKMRKVLKKKIGRYVGSYTHLMGWYFRNRHRRKFLPVFKLNGVLQHKKTSDYAAVNGKSMARVMRGGDDWAKPKCFRSETDRLTNFGRLFKLMMKSILVRIPGSETKGDVLEFMEPGRVEIQAEGESLVFDDMQKIEIRKAEKWVKVITNS